MSHRDAEVGQPDLAPLDRRLVAEPPENTSSLRLSVASVNTDGDVGRGSAHLGAGVGAFVFRTAKPDSSLTGDSELFLRSRHLGKLRGGDRFTKIVDCLQVVSVDVATVLGEIVLHLPNLRVVLGGR